MIKLKNPKENLCDTCTLETIVCSPGPIEHGHIENVIECGVYINDGTQVEIK